MKGMKVVVKILKILGATIGSFILLVGIGVALLNTTSVQQKLLQKATTLLAEHLETKVEIDSLRIGFFSDDVRLIGLRIDDRQQRRMLQIDYLGAELKMWKLARKEVYISEITVRGIKAALYKPSPDEPANYQFVLDAFKKKPSKETQDSLSQGKKPSPLVVNLKKATVEDAEVIYNENAFSFQKAQYKKGWLGKQAVSVHRLKASWEHVTKKKQVHVDDRLVVDAIYFEEKGDMRHVAIDSLRYQTDNHLPRRNTGKPKHGFFDEGHLDIVANLKADIDHVGKDTIHAVLTACDANDRGSGLHVRDLRCQVGGTAEKLHLTDVAIGLANTTLNFDSGDIYLPSKKKGRPLRFSTSTIKGRVLLKDIARPFAPVLHKFSVPLLLSVKFSGSDSVLTFRDVVVSTADKSLRIHARGFITGLKDKYQLKVHFDVSQMVTTGHTAEHIINQFAVKKFMMKQLNALGTIRYGGSFDVLYHREMFRGQLRTVPGFLNFNLLLNEDTKYLTGHVQTTGFELGKAMDMPDLGPITCRADFRFDYSKPRTAKMRRVKGGKLPIGEVKAEIDEAKYKFVKARNVVANLTSDGAVAEGKIDARGKRVDILCTFSFTNTNEMKKTKIKPGIRFHKMSDEDKAARAERKEQKKAEKAAKKEARKAEKEVKKAEKAKAKAEKDAQKAKAKAEKDAQKAKAKTEKDAQKAEKDAQKAKAKAEKDAQKAEKKAKKQAEKEARKAEKEARK